MNTFLPTVTKKTLLLIAVIASYLSGTSQTTVFTDGFDTSAGTGYTVAPGLIGSSNWTMSRSGNDFGARITNGMLTLTNDSGGTANGSGWVLAAASTGSFSTPYSPVLSSNPGTVTWTFNMRQINTNPSGFSTSASGVAFILAGSSGTTNVAGTGYAVVLGNSGSTDGVRLVRYTSGLRTHTTMITSNTSGLTDFGNQYLSVKVTYAPSTNTWQLFVRNDGTTAFQNPAAGSLTSQGTVVNNTYTAASLPIMGAFWNVTYMYFSSSNKTAFFDNPKVTVAVPTISSISPASKIAGTGAFTLTVNGTNFINGVSTVRWNGSNRTTSFVSANQLTAAINAADIISSGTASITVANGAAVSNSQTFTIDPAGVPTLSVSTTALAELTTVTGTASSALTYTISGANLTADPVVTPPANFEISTNGTTYVNSVTLPRTGNVLTSQPVTIYTRLKAAAVPGVYSGNIDNSVSGGASKFVAVTGTVLSAQPTTQATGVTFNTVTSTSFKINWTNGNGARRMVVLRAGAAVNASPVDSETYNGSPVFGSGTEVSSGIFTVYNGTANTVTVTGLSPATTYYAAVYELNGASGTENYLTTSPATGNRTTLNAPVGWQIYSANTTNTIDFDNTVDGVNAETFQANGVNPATESGELNSYAWAISGFSDGNIAFGATSAEDTDLDRGPSTGGETEGGIYAFETSTDNVSLGIQPATGDFAPGAVTLRFQNQSGAPITSVSIGYKVHVYNNQPASSSFNFSHSADNNAYTAIAGLDLVSPAAADVNPAWKTAYRVVTLTGLNIANNNYYYLRWSGAAVSGSGIFDEFGLDDIVLIANPTNNFASFAGEAESFVVQGNTSLSADLTVNGQLSLNSGKLDISGKTLTLDGNVANNVVGGLKGSAASNLVINGSVSPSLSFDQTTAGTTNLLNNLSINTLASNTVTLLNPVVINGTLTTAAGQTLNLGTNALTGTLTGIANNGTIATQNTTALPIPSGKTWSGNGTIHYNAASAQQTIVAGTYQNITVSTTGGAVAATSFTVNGTLNLVAGNPNSTTGTLSMGTHTLTMGGSAANAGIGDVTGIVTRNSIVPNVLYTFGHAHTSIIFPAAGTLPTSMSLKIAIGTAPSWSPNAINRFYDFIQTGGSGTKAVIKAHYLDSELNGNNENKLVDWAYIVPANNLIEQGRSNYNTTDNWVELTNVNVGAYFVSSFDVVKLTLDEYLTGYKTWNGSVSDSWTTAANWTPMGTPSDSNSVIIPDASTTPNDPLLNPAVLVGSVLIEPGGILNSMPDSQLTVTLGAGAWLNNGTFNQGSGTSRVLFSGVDATIGGVTTFNNITINTGASVRVQTDNVMKIAGAFVINGSFLSAVLHNTIEYIGTNQTIAMPTGTIAGYHNLIINGTGAIAPATLNVTGEFTLNQPVDFSGKTVTMLGTESQTINGTVSPVFNNLTINNTFGEVLLATNASVNGTLSLTAGKLNIGNHNLTLGANAVTGSFDSTKMIIATGSGELRRVFTTTGSYTFPIGENTGTTEYSPITVFVNSGGFSNAYVGVSVYDAIHPNNSSVENNLSRYWNVRQSGITGAVATITATYLPSDVTGAAGDVAAAQLNGTFNQQTNGWVKYAALSGTTLTASAAPLTNGQTSAITGIKGAPFTVLLSGYGSFCQNESVSLLGTPTGGDAPYTYSWSAGLGTAQTATPPTATVGTVSYTVTVRDNNGITASDTASVVVLSPSVGGTPTPNQNICAGTQPSDITLSGYNGAVTHWQSSADLNFTAPENISNISDVLTGASIGPLATTTYFRAVVQNGSCAEVFSAPVSIVVKSTTWDGTSWSNGNPDSATAIVFTGNYTASANVEACTITVMNNAAVVIPSGFDITIYGALTVTSGSFTLENNANLLQLTDVANSGNIVVKRNSSLLKRLDYTLWSSPVDAQQLLAFSPLTTAAPTSRFYTYNTTTNLYNGITSPSTTYFNEAQGYLIRMPNNHPSVTPTIWQGQFTGVPHNGPVTFTMADAGLGKRFNLVGNPYPSPIDAVEFVSDNSANITGTLYFWRKTNDASSPSYCSWTPGGGLVDNGEAQVFEINNVIRTGQGFFVEGNGNGTALNFSNSQRVGDNANQFFKQNEVERNRIWLNATSSSGAYSQALVGYITGATLDVDNSIDGRYINDGTIALTSPINGTEYAIQGRPLPFSPADVVPMTFKASTAGNYTIAIDHVDGLFLEGQEVYLKDNTTGTTHNLSISGYDFTSEAGTFTTRFEVVYQGALGTENPTFDANNTIVFVKDGKIFINTGTTTMDNVQVFDIRGRLVAEKAAVNSSETEIDSVLANQVLIVKITSDANEVVTRKVMN